LLVSIVLYVALCLTVVGFVYILMFAIFGFFAQGLMVAGFRGNGIKVSEQQFPEIYQLAYNLAEKMGINPMPDIYVFQSGGIINAFATKFMGRKFVILYSEIVEVAYEEGEDALAFVIAHELAHFKRRHVQLRWLVLPAFLIPFLGTAYSRACEYTCDSFGYYFHPEGAVAGILILAAGNKLYRRVNVEELHIQARNETGFFLWLYEHLSTHPNLSKRVDAFYNSQIRTNTAIMH